MRPVARNERGVALIVTLLVITLLAIIVVEFTHSTEVDAHLTRNARNAAQARYLARSGLALAEITLKLDAADKSKTPPERPPIETLSDPWAQPFPPMVVGDGFGTAGFTIIDESGRFNLNALAVRTPPPEAVMRQQLFQGILEVLGLEPNLLYPLLDWLDPGDDSDRESGAEAPYYLGLRPPYVPRNGRFVSLEEVALVKGFELLTWEQWNAFRSIVTVLPNEELHVNVNTASPLLLRALFLAFDAEAAGEALVGQREEAPFGNAGELRQFLTSWQIPPLASAKFDVRSQTFTIYATGTSGDVEQRIGVTEEIRRQQFPPRLSVLAWREGAAPPSLTSEGASGGMNSVLP